MREAFSLVELLIVMAIIAILFSLMSVVAMRMRTFSNNLRCISNLHTIGVALLTYASDHDGKTPTAYTLDSTQINVTSFWHQILVDNGYLSPRVLCCPSCPPYNYPKTGVSLQTYGLRRNSTPWENRFDPAFQIGKTASLSSYVLVADSINPVSNTQFYYLDYPGFSWMPNQIDVRHNGKANILFGDGHVQSLTPKEILNLDDGWINYALHAPAS
ncbi:MAG: prepilin-type N-terminal cleavage/methylation domain-containing protein [Chloroflexota bacterium]